MEFNQKLGKEYCANLTRLISDVKTSLVSRGIFSSEKTGLYEEKITKNKSELNISTGKDYEDETETIEMTGALEKIDPMIRVQMIRDLIEERTKVEYEVCKLKNEHTYKNTFLEKDVSYDFGNQVNREYQELQNLLKELLELEEKVLKDSKESITDVSSDGQGTTLSFSVKTEKTLRVDKKQVNNMYQEIYDKCKENSILANGLEIAPTFIFEPKFKLSENITSLIERYSNED